MKNKYSKQNGSITLFLCLIFTIMLSFLMLVLESARIHIIKAHTEGLSHMAMESVSGYFSLPLFENYGIFSIHLPDSSLTPLVEKYIRWNISPEGSISGEWYDLCKISSFTCNFNKIYHITDDNGKIFTNQIIRYMTYAVVTDAADIFFQFPFIDTISKDFIDISKINIEQNQVDTSFSLSELSNDADSDNENMLTEEEALSKRDSILSRIKGLLTNGTLNLYIDKASDISTHQTDLSMLPSTVCSYQKHLNISDFLSESEKLMLLIYFSDTFHCYTDKKSNTAELEYQLEYLLHGSSRDEDNLLKSILGIQSLRTGLNLAYLYTDSEKRQMVRTLAHTAVGLIPVPFIVEFTQLAILSAWASAEAIVDVRDLLKGVKIPLFKTKADWSLSLDDILTFDYNTKSKSQSNGCSYKQYLQLFLYTDLNTDMTYRAMDLIQMDIKKNYNPEFQMTECITGMNYHFNFNYYPVFYINNPYYKKSSLFTHSFIQSYGY